MSSTHFYAVAYFSQEPVIAARNDQSQGKQNFA